MEHRIIGERLSHPSDVLEFVPVAGQQCSGGHWIGGCGHGQCWREGCAFYHTIKQACRKPGGLKGRRHLLVLIDGEKYAPHSISPNLADAISSCGRARPHCSEKWRPLPWGAWPSTPVRGMRGAGHEVIGKERTDDAMTSSKDHAASVVSLRARARCGGFR